MNPYSKELDLLSQKALSIFVEAKGWKEQYDAEESKRSDHVKNKEEALLQLLRQQRTLNDEIKQLEEGISGQDVDEQAPNVKSLKEKKDAENELQKVIVECRENLKEGKEAFQRIFAIKKDHRHRFIHQIFEDVNENN